MPLVIKDRVQQTSNTTGTGTVTLSGTLVGFQTFSNAIGNTNTTYYTIQNPDSGEWEVGIGTVGVDTLSRDTVLESSNAGSLVSFTSGTKYVFCTYPAEKSVYKDETDKVSGYVIENSSIGATTASTGKFTSVTTPSVTATTNDLTLNAISTGVVNFNTANGTQFRIADTFAGGTATNYFQVQGRASFQPVISTTGASTNIPMQFSTKGSGDFSVWTNGGNQQQFGITHTASAVNYVQATGSITNSRPSISAQGSDANIGLTYSAKGSSLHAFSNGEGTQFAINAVGATIANRLNVTASATGQSPNINVSGTDTNIDLTLAPKGTGGIVGNVNSGTFAITRDSVNNAIKFTATNASNLYLQSTGGGAIVFNTADSLLTQARISSTLSAVNYLEVTGASTTNSPSVSAVGSDATINFDIAAKGGGEIRFKPNGNAAAVNFAVSFTGATVNYLTATGSGATGNAPRLFVQGSDTNASLAIQPKGTGAINLAAGSSGVNISNGNTVTAITRTAIGSAYTSIPSVAISAPTTAGGVQAVGQAVGSVIGVTINNGGTGYTVNDVLTIVGGTNTVVATLTVSTVSAGVITAVTISAGGQYTVAPANPVSVTGGTGTSATFNLTYGVASVNVTTAGSGYIEQPTVTFSGGGGSGAAAYAAVGSIPTVKSIGSAISFSTAGGEQFRVIDSPASTQYLSVAGGTGGQVTLNSAGTGTSSINYVTNGANNHRFWTTGGEHLRVAHTASAVNFVQVTGNTTGNRPIISAQGSDTNISMQLLSKGTGSVSTFVPTALGGTIGNTAEVFSAQGINNNTVWLRASQFRHSTGVDWTSASLRLGMRIDAVDMSYIDFNPIGFSQGIAIQSANAQPINFRTSGGEQLRVNNTVSAVNFIQISGGATNNPAYVAAQGSDTNVGLNLFSKGTESVDILTGSGGVRQAKFTHTASAVNFVQVTGATTANNPTILAQGSDTNISLQLSPKGTGLIQLSSAANIARNSFNWMQISGGAATGNAPTLTALGTDTNIDLTLTPKGTGVIQFGTLTANADAPITGYITIRDAGGTLRKLAVIA